MWTSAWHSIRSGTWLTAARITNYARLILVLSAAIGVAWIALSHDLIDRKGKPIGTDFTNVWVAGALTLKGDAAAPYDPVRQHQAEKEAFGRDVPFYGWHYPPLFLLVAAALALLPYGWALLAWMALTLPLYLLAARAILPRPETLLLALAFPAVIVNLGHGQNGFLSAALIGGGLVLLNRRPVAAGILFGLMAYKPQFGLLLPLVLAASVRWTAFVSASATVMVASALSLLLLGPESWIAFFESTAFTRAVILEQGATGWAKIQSVFAAMRMWDLPVSSAYAAQIGVGIAVAVSLVWLWRSAADFDLKAAGLATGSLLVTPYLLDYDLMVLAVSIAFTTRYGLKAGFRPFETSLLATAWLIPLFARSVAGFTYLPIGQIVMLALYVSTLARAWHDLSQSEPNRSDALVKA